MMLEDILPRFNGVKKTPNGYQAKCPAHEDKNASLSLAQAPDKILLDCKAGCKFPDVLGAIGLKPADAFSGARNTEGNNSLSDKSGRQIVCTYDYPNAEGKLVFQVVRYPNKDFVQRRPDGKGGWIWNMQGVERVLYNLPKVTQDIAKGLPILICEGEKDCNNLKPLGFTATCNPGGAKKWLQSYSEALRGATCYIIPDNDKPGREHAELVQRELQDYAAKVQIVTLPEKFNGRTVKDASDLISAGGKAADFVELIDQSAIPAIIRELQQRQFNPENKPEAVPPVYKLNGVPICTPGNLTAINAQAKAGKSALVSAMIASAIAGDAERDTLNLWSSNPEGKALLHFDTEQSTEDHWHLIDRALRRAGARAMPSWVLSFCLSGWTAQKSREAVWEATEYATTLFTGIHSILIDGVADLVTNVNDPPECNPFVAELHALAIKHACPIIGVIHFNPGSEKTRGHLGSQLERKSETNLRLDKEGEVSVVWSEKQRRAPILKDNGPRFAWSDDAGMHVSVETGRQIKDAAKIEKLLIERDDAFGDRPAMRYSELVSTLKNNLTVSTKTAERRFDELRQYKLIEKHAANLYIKKGLQ